MEGYTSLQEDLECPGTPCLYMLFYRREALLSITSPARVSGGLGGLPSRAVLEELEQASTSLGFCW